MEFPFLARLSFNRPIYTRNCYHMLAWTRIDAVVIVLSIDHGLVHVIYDGQLGALSNSAQHTACVSDRDVLHVNGLKALR